jgi:hypothetical protein
MPSRGFVRSPIIESWFSSWNGQIPLEYLSDSNWMAGLRKCPPFPSLTNIRYARVVVDTPGIGADQVG